MSEESRFPLNTSQNALSCIVDSNSAEEDLLVSYLAMPLKQRDAQFIDTAAAAKMAGISQRTIELWIEGGLLQAVLIGKKYKVNVPSLVAYLKGKLNKKMSSSR